MNREILFRGKGNPKYNDGDWYYGYLLFDGEDYQIVEPGYCSNCRTVLNETVGQHIGLNDRQDKPIFEGDIVEVDGEEFPFLIEYDEQDAIWLATNHYGILSFRDNITGDDCAIIGNICENPNLLSK